MMFGPAPQQSLSIDGEKISREDLIGRAHALAGEIDGAAVVAVNATATVHTAIAVVGALLAGIPVVPLPPDAGPGERAHILRDSAAELSIGSEDFGVPRVAIPSQSDHRPHRRVPADATALILYTSGTTGPPKGALLSHAAVEAGLDALAEAWAWTPDDIVVHGLPLFHVHGLVLGVLGPLRIGSGLIHTGRPTPASYAAAGGSLYFGVPTVWSRICESGSAAELRSARLLVSGSAALPTPVFEKLAALTGHRPIERYGMTETLITLSARHDGERRPGFVGTPLTGVSTRLADEDGRPVPADGQSPGELYVRAPMAFTGYLNRPDATAAALQDGWFRTGDIATIGPDGWHRIVGRASIDLIKSGGYKIGAGEVENALLAHPEVREAAVVGAPHADLGEQVTAYVVASDVNEQELMDFVARDLSAHKRPRIVHFVDELPRNSMGKVLKRELGK